MEEYGRVQQINARSFAGKQGYMTKVDMSNENESMQSMLSMQSLIYSSPASSNSDVLYQNKALPPLGYRSKPQTSTSINSAKLAEIAGNIPAQAPHSGTTISTNRRLAFLETLEAIPLESDILTLKKLANTMSVNLYNPELLHTTFMSFTSCLRDICSRANYWSWAPNYMTFLILLVRGEFGTVTENTVIRYAMHTFCLFSCHVCKYDPEREPAIYTYLSNFFIPQIMKYIKENDSDDIESSIMALSYVFYKIPVDEKAIIMVQNLRVHDMKDFHRSSNTMIRYQRAIWLSCISHQLILRIKKGEDVEKNKALILKCYDEVLFSHEHEKVSKIAKTYELYFDIKSQE